MSDADALLDAVFADPDADTPRLVYADWLDDHGHPDYAAFMRLQCEAARHPVWSPEANRLWEEIGRVWTRLRDVYELDEFEGWAVPNGYEAGNIDAVYFARGFLRPAVWVRTDQLVRSESAWWPWFPTGTCSLRLVPWWLDRAASCRSLARIRELRLSLDEDAGPASLSEFLTTAELTGLRTLDLTAVSLYPADIEFFYPPEILPSLQEVRLRLYEVSRADFTAAAGVLPDTMEIAEARARLAVRINNVVIDPVVIL